MLTSLQPWKRAKVTYKLLILRLQLYSSFLLLFKFFSGLIVADGSFDYKKFFATCGLTAKSADEVKKAFNIIDQDKSGFIEEDELK